MRIPPEIVHVAEHLGELRDEVVFVGGMVRSLLVTDPVVPGYRPTRDVDMIMDSSNYVQHAEWLETAVSRLLQEASFKDALPGHLPPDAASQARIKLVLERLTALSLLS